MPAWFGSLAALYPERHGKCQSQQATVMGVAVHGAVPALLPRGMAAQRWQSGAGLQQGPQNGRSAQGDTRSCPHRASNLRH